MNRASAEELLAMANHITFEGRWEASALKHTCLLGWNRGELPVDYLADNGSCCLLQTRPRRFLVTCAHVWLGYEEYLRRHEDARLWLSLLVSDDCSVPSLPLPLTNPRLLDIENSLDLATILFDEIELLDDWRFWQFRNQNNPTAQVGDLIHFAGFSGDGVREGNPSRTLNYYYSPRVVEEVTKYRFILHDEPTAIHHENAYGEKIPPVRIAGVSGAPAFKVLPNLSLELAGIVREVHSSGMRNNLGQQYELGDGDVHVTHACFFQENGEIAILRESVPGAAGS